MPAFAPTRPPGCSDSTCRVIRATTTGPAGSRAARASPTSRPRRGPRTGIPLLLAVHRFVLRGHGSRRLPLRQPGRTERDQAGPVLREARRRWSRDNQTLPGALDIEYGPRGRACYGLRKAKMIRWITAFTDRVQAAHQSQRGDLHHRRLVEPLHREHEKFSATNPLWAARWGPGRPEGCPAVGRWPPSGSTAAPRSTRTSSIRPGRNLTKFANGD